MGQFHKNTIQIAKVEMDKVDKDLVDKYAMLMRFLSEFPDSASKFRSKKIIVGSEEYIKKHVSTFVNSRKLQSPKSPQTIQDTIVPLIMEKYFDVAQKDMEKALRWHRLAMGAENIIGHLLEKYIAENLEGKGWLWCSGSFVKAVDFIYQDEDGKWTTLQVKNRDNSENSSSQSVREGTNIQKWFRSFSKKPGDNWNNFPACGCNHDLSEKNFKIFVEEQLKALK